MNITLTGTKITQDNKFLAFEKNNDVDVINITVDTDESWTYKLDVKYPDKCCSGEQLYNIINIMRTGNICSAVLTKDMLPFTGKYIMQLRGISDDKVYHSDTFDCWVKYSIEPASTYDPVPSEFYQIEDNITEINNNPPKPGENGYWLIWDVTTHQYKESAIPLPDGTLPGINVDTSGKYLSNDGKKAYWAEVQTGTESKIDKIEVNGVEQPIVDKTVDIAVPTKTSDLSNDSGYITNEALEGYATKAELPTKVSQLENDSKFINESALDGYAKTADIPTKTSQLNNDSGYITANDVPVKSVDGATGDVVTNAVKTTSQTLTDAQKQQARENIGAGTSSFDGDYNSLSNKPIIPTKTSDITNDSGFITNDALLGKQDKITGAATTITNSNLTANCALISDTNGKVAVSPVTATELACLDGVTSNIQAQLNRKLETVHDNDMLWGGKNLSDEVSPTDAAMVSVIGGNKFALCKPQGITVEYTNDGGATWINYDATDETKINVISGISNANLYYGKKTESSQIVTADDMLRITVNAFICGVYTSLRKILIEFATDGSINNFVKIESATIGDQEAFTVIGTYNLDGNSGWNSIPYSNNFGAYSLAQTFNVGVLRFTFSTRISSSYKGRPYVKNLILNGITNYVNPSKLSAIGHLYSYDYQQNATFPANVTANKFYGDGSNLTNLPIDALPAVTTADNGKVLCVVDGKWEAVTLPST